MKKRFYLGLLLIGFALATTLITDAFRGSEDCTSTNYDTTLCLAAPNWQSWGDHWSTHWF